MPHTIKTIVCPMDFSEAAKAALNAALSLAERFDAEVRVVHVLEVPHPSTQVINDGLREYAETELNSLIKHLPHGGPKATAVLADGPPAQAIVEQAKKLGADLIVISTHGRSGFVHALLGSVAERVVRLASCPVLSIPASALETQEGASA